VTRADFAFFTFLAFFGAPSAGAFGLPAALAFAFFAITPFYRARLTRGSSRSPVQETRDGSPWQG
ncbi:MAG: hypothetical protein ACREOF_17865, partial [Gemmatimonadales bacterium]